MHLVSYFSPLKKLFGKALSVGATPTHCLPVPLSGVCVRGNARCFEQWDWAAS
jgi:hypothetical protein